MFKCKIKAIPVLCCCILLTTAEDVSKLTTNQKTQYVDTTQQNQTSLLSKVSLWFLPNAQSRADHNDLQTSATNYGPPQYYGPSSINDCNLCNQSPWIPIIGHKDYYDPPSAFSSHRIQQNNGESFSEYFNNGPSNFYQSPQQNNYIPPSKVHYDLPQATVQIPDYMMPPPAKYKIPVPLYGAPQNSYGPPQYFPPSSSGYRTQHSFVNGHHKPVYGPPQKPVYGPPISPPRPVYGIPPKSKYGPPTKIQYNSIPQYAPPPNIQYGPPPKPDYGTPIKYNSPPKSTYNVNSVENYVPTNFGSNNFYEAPLALRGPQKGFNGGGFIQSYAGSAPSGLGSSPTGFKNSPSSYVTESSNFVNVPSDSYGLPVTSENVALADAIGASSGDFDEQYEPQIPLPNLSSLPLLPIRNHRNFNKNFVSKSLPLDGKVRGNTDVQIQPSVEVANYVASIEYPINVIQSPVVDVAFKEQVHDESIQQLPHEKPNQIFQNAAPKDQHEFSHQNTQYSQNIQDELEKNEHETIDSSVNFKDNPIIVEDTNAAASEIRNTTAVSKVRRNNEKDTAIVPSNNKPSSSTHNNEDTSLFQQLLEEVDKTIQKTSKPNKMFTPSPIDYSAWKPTTSNTLATSMLPPPMQTTSSWVSQNKNQNRYQIIVPYTNGKKNSYYNKDWPIKTTKWQSPKDTYTTLSSVYSPPMQTETSIWAKFMEDVKLTETKGVPANGFTQPTTITYNSEDLLANEDKSKDNSVSVSNNMFALQNAIDNWTHQSYATANLKKERLPSKNIPNLYFSTQPLSTSTERIAKSETNSNDVTTSKTHSSIFDNKGLQAVVNTLIALNNSGTIKPKKIKQIPDVPLWNTSQITESPQTKEKIYVVTPQSYGFFTSTPATAWSLAPKVENGKINNGTYDSHKFTVRVEADSSKKIVKDDKSSAIKVVYSEWPHLINSLETTTPKATSRHPLLGLMDISEYTPAPNTTVETFFGHSKVATVSVTPPTQIVTNSSTLVGQ